MSLAAPGAPVTIVEYADYQCPYCAQWATDVFPAVVDEYVRPGKVRMVFQGVAILGEDSVTALQAAVSAGIQDKQWNVGELLYHNQGAENSGWVTDDLLRDIGASVPGLDVDAMMDGRESAEVADAMGEAQADAQAAGITGTPSFEITKRGGQPTLLQGARPLDEFRQSVGRPAPVVTESRLRTAVGVLALLGLGIAAYLTYLRYAGGSPYCIAGGGGCEQVQESEYAKLAGIPVAVLGLVAYAALLVTALVPGPVAAAAGAGIALAGVAFSAWLLYAQLALIDAVCQWCVANDVVIALAAVAAVWRLRQST